MNTSFRVIQLIYLSLVITPTFFALATYYLFTTGYQASGETQDILMYLPATSLLFSVPLGNFLYKKAITQVNPQMALKSKLSRYQIAIILRAALIELAALLASVVCYLSGNILLLLVAPICWVLFYFNRPTIAAMEMDLLLSPDEVKKLRGS
ncbi:MAG: hypothetical protein AAFX57_11790 [Bacteroidota bacterium]